MTGVYYYLLVMHSKDYFLPWSGRNFGMNFVNTPWNKVK